MQAAVEFGIFHEFAWPAAGTEAEAFDNAFALVDVAERGGLDAIWLAELHINRRSVLSSPLTIASAVAARTSRIKIGTAVQVLPLYHPLQLAEEAATVDQISKGRFIFGVGRSGFATTYQAYGVSYAESRERFAETLEIVRRAWTQERFSFDGSYWQFHDVFATPKPFQKPHPPIRIAANSPDTFISIGAQGFPIFAAVRLGTLSELRPHLDEYRAAYQASGAPGSGEVFLRVPVFVAEDARAARDIPEASIMQFYRQLGEQMVASAGAAGSRAVEDRAGRGQVLRSLRYEDVLREKAIVGTPGQVAERLAEVQAELGLDGILAEMNPGGQLTPDQVLQSLKLLCDQVMPRFA